VSDKTRLESSLPGGEIKACAVVEVDGDLSGCHNQQHQESDGQGELDEALASLPGPLPSDHSWESVPISGEKTRNRIRTSSGRTKKTRAGTVITDRRTRDPLAVLGVPAGSHRTSEFSDQRRHGCAIAGAHPEGIAEAVECLNAVTLANLVKRRFELDPLDFLNSQGFAKQVASRVLVGRRRRRQRSLGSRRSTFEEHPGARQDAR